MTGISYITDEKGRQNAVVISLKKHKKLWEDFYDALIIEERKNEKRIPYEVVKRELMKK
ncbi:MAG: hypothetical protein NTX03_03980 [Bacteroidetes bacterium]|nr:hypothetical protein [Bacteroidota bacterium]